jgi:hypothetical protein
MVSPKHLPRDTSRLARVGATTRWARAIGAGSSGGGRSSGASSPGDGGNVLKTEERPPDASTLTDIHVPRAPAAKMTATSSNAGSAGTGMPVKVLPDLRRRLDPIASRTSPLSIGPPRSTRFSSPPFPARPGVADDFKLSQTPHRGSPRRPFPRPCKSRKR